jgi:hypothetical protein
LDLSANFIVSDISGGKTSNYRITWQKSQTFTGTNAINFSQSYSTLNYIDIPLDDLNVSFIAESSLKINNNAPYTEGVPRVIIYKCEITDILNTKPIIFYFKAFYVPLYKITPCFDGDISVYTTTGLIKIKNLNSTHQLYNLTNGTSYPVLNLFMKSVQINPADNNNSLYIIPFNNGKTEAYLSTAIINSNTLVYKYINTQEYLQYKSNVIETKIMYHILTDNFIKNNIFTENGLQLKSYGSPLYIDVEAEENNTYLIQDDLLGGLYLNYLFIDTISST